MRENDCGVRVGAAHLEAIDNLMLEFNERLILVAGDLQEKRGGL